MRKLRAIADEWQALHAPDGEADRVARQRNARSLTLTLRADGMTAVQGLLDPASATTVRSALDAMVERTIHDQSGRTRDQRMADALTAICDLSTRGQLTGGRNSGRVLVTVDYETVFARARGTGVASTGDSLDADTVRKLCCDAGLHRVVTAGGSAVLDFGHERRLATDSQYLALVARDQGCRFPGCTMPPTACEVHHITPVSEGGRTDLSDMVLECYIHHQLAHTAGWSVTGTGEALLITTPTGDILVSRPPERTTRPPGERLAVQSDEFPDARGDLPSDRVQNTLFA